MGGGAVGCLSPLTEDTGTQSGVFKLTAFESTEWGIRISGLSHPACFGALEGPETQDQNSGESRLSEWERLLSSGETRSAAAGTGAQEGRSVQQLKEPVNGDRQQSDDYAQVCNTAHCPSPRQERPLNMGAVFTPPSHLRPLPTLDCY